MNDSGNLIALIEDDLQLAAMIRERLTAEGFTVLHEANGKDGTRTILARQPDLVILDIMLPGMDGFSVCRSVRGDFHGPILILTARDDDLDQILGFELGADDFVVKPVRPRVLMARIRALLRRHGAHAITGENRRVRIEELVVDAERREARLSGKMLDLTTVEFNLLWYLVTHAGRVLSRNDIHIALYQSEYDGMDRSIDVYISRLRQKLGEDTTSPHFLKTVRGEGYLFSGTAT